MAGKTPDSSTIYGSTALIKQEPHCPADTSISYTSGDATTDPTCSYSQTDANDTSIWHSLNRTTSGGGSGGGGD